RPALVAGAGGPAAGPVLREHPDRGVRARPQPGLPARRADVDEVDLAAVWGEIERSRLTLQLGHALVVVGPGRSGRPGRERVDPRRGQVVRQKVRYLRPVGAELEDGVAIEERGDRR